MSRISITKKFIILFVCGVVIPLCLQNFTYYFRTEKNIQNEMLEKLNASLIDKEMKINGALSGVLTLTRTYYKNEAIYRFLDTDYRNDLSFLITYQENLKKLFEDNQLFYLQIKNNLIYTTNNTLFNSYYIRSMKEIDKVRLGEPLVDVSLVPIGAEDEQQFLRIAREDKRQIYLEDRSISIIRVLDYFPQHQRSEKLLRIDIDTSYFTSILSESNLFENMFVTDLDGRVIMSAHTFRENGEFDYFKEEEQENGMVVLSKPLGEFPLILYGLYDPGVISQEFKSSRRWSIGITALSLLLALACVAIVVRNITRRLYLVVKQSEEIAKGNFIQMDVDKDGIDEISLLEKSVNQMSMKLQELIEKEYKSELEQAYLEQETTQAKLLALQSQVNPHFMFNALESIRLKAMAKGEAETARMIKYMSRMFRNLINWDNSIITLQEEIKFLDEFLHIQNYRFEDEFSYNIDVSKEAQPCLVPKMIVQPLVENACVHGVEAISNDRQVNIKANVDSGILHILVSDNGGGMSEIHLAGLMASCKEDVPFGQEKNSGKSVGLRNVYRRLKLYYGEQFSFTIESEQGKGTECRISIPATEKEKTSKNQGGG